MKRLTGSLQEEVEATVLLDWENGYVECSAKVSPTFYIFSFSLSFLPPLPPPPKWVAQGWIRGGGGG